MPGIVADTLSKKPLCEISICKNDSALETASWAYTPYINYASLTTLDYILHIVNLHVLIAPTDNGLLALLGKFVAARSDILRSLRIKALGRLWPGSNMSMMMISSYPNDDQDAKVYLVRSMAWLVNPLKDKQRSLHLRELELTNFCICQSEMLDLETLLDQDRLRSLKLSCFRPFAGRRLEFTSLDRLALAFRTGSNIDREKCITNWPRESVREFLLTCRGIRQLQLLDRPDVLNEEVSHTLAASLRSLHMCRTGALALFQEPRSTTHAVARTEGYPESLVDLLSRTCPSMESLSIGVLPPRPKLHSFFDQVLEGFPSLGVLNVSCSTGPDGLPTDELGNRFKGADILPIWHRFDERRGSSLRKMSLSLRMPSKSAHYSSALVKSYAGQGSDRTYTVTRSADGRMEDSLKVEVKMEELCLLQKMIREDAPQPDSRVRCRHDVLGTLFNHGCRTRLLH